MGKQKPENDRKKLKNSQFGTRNRFSSFKTLFIINLLPQKRRKRFSHSHKRFRSIGRISRMVAVFIVTLFFYSSGTRAEVLTDPFPVFSS